MKFIHLADVHLGAVPDKGFTVDGRREEIWDTFRRVIANIRSNPVEFLFIAGDLFNRQPLMEELSEVNELFKSIPETRVYLSAGDSDYMRKGSSYYKFRWAENVTFIADEELTCVKDPVYPVYVYGFSYHHKEIKFSLLKGAKPESDSGIHILMAHGGDEKHVPIDARGLFRDGFDYIALGHIHKPSSLVRNHAAYAGSLEPLNKKELGKHGYIEGEIIDGRVNIKFVRFAKRNYRQIVIEIDQNTSQKELEEKTKAEMEKSGTENVYRLILQGERAPEVLLMPERLKKLGNVMEVVDESRPKYDLEAIYKRYRGTLIGDFIESFSGRELTHTDEKAMYYGLQALLETRRHGGK